MKIVHFISSAMDLTILDLKWLASCAYFSCDTYSNSIVINTQLFMPFILGPFSFFLNSCIFIVILQAADAPMVQQDFLSANQLPAETEGNNPLPAPPPLDEECESMDSTNSNDGEPAPSKPENTQSSYPMLYPAYYSPVFPFPLPYWSGYSPAESTKKETHEVLKPTAVHSKSPINVDELVGISKLSLGESIADSAPSSLSLKLNEEGPSRQSAFHATPGCGSSNVNGSAIHAV